jgi:5,6-dimethylbenzimidazole synthase
MSKRTFLVTGGCRSGKSKHALALGNQFPGKKIYIATAEALDAEMKTRIALHQEERDSSWTTVEEPQDPASAIKNIDSEDSIILLDCLSIWVANLLLADRKREDILEQTKILAEISLQSRASVIIVTNEVGAGIVPDNKLAREYRDIIGEANQIIASHFDEVAHCVSGIPVTIKAKDKENFQKKTSDESSHEFSPEKKQGLYDAIYKRRDVRHFNSKPVPPSVLGKILNAAHHAGSVGFMQPWNFMIIDDIHIKTKVKEIFERCSETAAKKFSEDREKLYKSLKLEGIMEAPINLCITCNRNRLGPNVLGRDTIPEMDLMSAACAVQNLWLAARAEGVGVGWVSILSQEELKTTLEIPDDIVPIAYLCIGYTDNFLKKPMLQTVGWEDRLSIEKLVYYNKWEGKPGEKPIEFPSGDF